MQFGRLSGNTLKPHSEPNSMRMNGVGKVSGTFSGAGIDFRIRFDPKAARKTRRAVAAIDVSKEGRSWRKPSPSVQG